MHDIEPSSRASADSASAGSFDPGALSGSERRLLGAWLCLQSALSLFPGLARRSLESAGGDPELDLARSGKSAVVEARRIEEWIEILARHAVRAVPITSTVYPERLRILSDPPPLLLVRGSIEIIRRPAVAIVGARAATRYGLGVAESLAGELSAAGYAVVSGLARGIDAAAHRGALAGGGRTLAVLGCGPDLIYPPEHRSLAERILERGTILSELTPGSPPARHHFPLRNRLISGLVRAVVVVEARPRSGSLITARHALEQGREVLVVPGPIDCVTSAGSNALLRDGAQPVLDSADVLGALGNPEKGLPGRRSGESEPVISEPPMDPAEAQLLEMLREEPASRDELMRRLGCEPRELALLLMALELGDRIREDRDGRLRAIPRGRIGVDPRD